MQYVMRKPVTRIGRDVGNDVALPGDHQASRYHAEVRNQGGLYVLYDLNSTNGTFVNGRRVTTHRLANGDRVRVGGGQMTFHDGMLLLEGGAVAGRGRAGAPYGARPAGDSTPMIIAVVGVLVTAVLLVAILLFNTGGGGSSLPEQIARNWVKSNFNLIVGEIVAHPATSAIPSERLDRPVLHDKVRQRLATGEWRYSTLPEVTEGVYRVEAKTTFSVGMVSPPDYVIAAIYVLTVDTNSKTVKDYRLDDLTVTESR